MENNLVFPMKENYKVCFFENIFVFFEEQFCIKININKIWNNDAEEKRSHSNVQLKIEIKIP